MSSYGWCGRLGQPGLSPEDGRRVWQSIPERKPGGVDGDCVRSPPVSGGTKIHIPDSLHGDHTGAAEKIRELTGAEIICHRDESRLLAGTGEIEYCWNRPMPRTGLTPFLRMVSAAGYGLMKANTAPLQADILVKDGDMPFGPEWTVIHLPGHTPGSCGLWSERHRILFAGDTVLCVGRRTIHPPVSFLIQDRSKFYQSWCRLNRLGEINWILPGHFRPLRWNGPLDILPAVQKYA